MKYPISLIILISFCHLVHINSQAQIEERNYKTNDYTTQLKQAFSYHKSSSQIERTLTGALRFEEATDRTLPIVFHVLYNTEEQRISVETIQRQLDLINADFSNQVKDSYKIKSQDGDLRQIEGYKKMSKNARVQFCFAALAQTKQEGPILYKKTKTKIFDDFFSMKEKKTGSQPVGPTQYLNVWICNLGNDNSGFAQMPGGPAEYDGVVIDYRFLKRIDDSNSLYHLGHTLTHLIGNYLGLYPLWGESPCADDYVSDTPIHNAPNYRCPEMNQISTCDGRPTEMTNNFMDNTDDACMEMFTSGQVYRMQLMLNPMGPRGTLANAHTVCEQMEIAHVRKNEINAATEEMTLSHNVLKVFPNPVQDLLQVNYTSTLGKGTYEIMIHNLSGQLMIKYSKDRTAVKQTVDVSTWTAGIYLVQIRDGNEVLSNKIIVE